MEMWVHSLLFFTIFTFSVYSCSGHSTFHEGDGSEIRANFGTGNAMFFGETRTTRSSRAIVVNVDDFGAKADHKTDDSLAFLRAWNESCATRGSVFLVPAHKVYHLKPVIFVGPCQSRIVVKIKGRLVASKNMSDYEQDRRHWIMFANLTDLTVNGGGVLHGNGQMWWPLNCHINKTLPCIDAPTALAFRNCTNLKVKHLKIKNAPQIHMNIIRSANVEASKIMIKSNGTSPNTDGIHVAQSRKVTIKHCQMETGDDCISIVGGSSHVQAKHINCGPGHGISIGSLGGNRARDIVSDVKVRRATFRNTKYGVRIKSWQGGRGYAKNIIFENIKIHNVAIPITIDQFYCNVIGHNCSIQRDNVKVENVLYKNIKGTSATEYGIVFNCSATVPCEGIKLENVQLKQQNGNDTSTLLASCSNVLHLEEQGRNTLQCPN